MVPPLRLFQKTKALSLVHWHVCPRDTRPSRGLSETYVIFAYVPLLLPRCASHLHDDAFARVCPLFRQENRAQRLTIWVRRPPGGVGVFHAKGWWSKSSCPPLKVCLPWVWKWGTWDVPGILPGCPGALRVFENSLQERFVRIFCFPIFLRKSKGEGGKGTAKKNVTTICDKRHDNLRHFTRCNQRHFRQLKGPSVPVTGGSVPLTGPSVPLMGGSVPPTGLF